MAPKNADAANAMILHIAPKYFDYGNHENVRIVAANYFKDGYPFEPHLSGLIADLQDMKTIRNACAHIGAGTQKPLEGLALRIFGAPRPAITVYDLLMAVDPKSLAGETVFRQYKAKLVTAVALIAQG